MAKSKQYVGVNGTKYQRFASDVEPTRETHGDQYAAVIGPFRTVRGAQYMADHGCGNPHLQTVDNAELYAEFYAERAGRCCR